MVFVDSLGVLEALAGKSEIAEAALKAGAVVIGISALLTTTMEEQKGVIKVIRDGGPLMLSDDIYVKASSLLGGCSSEEEAVGPRCHTRRRSRGHFLAHRHTRRLMKEAALPAISHGLGADGHYCDPLGVARECAGTALRDDHPEPLAADQRHELRRIVNATGGDLRW